MLNKNKGKVEKQDAGTTLKLVNNTLQIR